MGTDTFAALEKSPQQCPKTRADKARAEHVGWVALPLDIIEKIIAHAVSGDKKDDEPLCNWYAERVVNYGAVCSSWKRAIMLSRTIFQRDKSLSSEELCPKRLIIHHDRCWCKICKHDCDSRTIRERLRFPTLVLTKFIEEGYLPAVKFLDLRIVKPKECIMPTTNILKAIARKNSIERLRLKFNCSMYIRRLREVNRLVKRLAKANHFELTMWIFTQKQSKCLWELMCTVVHSNSCAKTIKLKYYLHPSIEWGFINETERLNVGSIAQLTLEAVGGATATIPTDVFTKLADIDTIVERR